MTGCYLSLDCPIHIVSWAVPRENRIHTSDGRRRSLERRARQPLSSLVRYHVVEAHQDTPFDRDRSGVCDAGVAESICFPDSVSGPP